MSSRRRNMARVTVWYPGGPLVGEWHSVFNAQFAWQIYEYYIGVPATVEYSSP